jgi:hypothetical protein
MKLGAVTWLDFRADDLSQARDFIRSLQEEGVIDELGFLALQGRFSDLLHPARTTLMRSARYLFFVAGIYRQLEWEGGRSSQVALLAQQRQDALASVLTVKESVGVIGREAGMTLRQFPSLISVVLPGLEARSSCQWAMNRDPATGRDIRTVSDSWHSSRAVRRVTSLLPTMRAGGISIRCHKGGFEPDAEMRSKADNRRLSAQRASFRPLCAVKREFCSRFFGGSVLVKADHVCFPPG